MLAVAAVSASAHAGLVNPLIPSWSGGANTQRAQWDSFTQPSGGANVPDQAGSSPFSLFNFGPGAFITGSGNIYSQNGVLSIMLMGGTLNNVATAGSTLNLSSVRLTLFDNIGNSMSIAPALSELRADSPTPPQGAAQTWAFTWNTAGVPLTATGFRVEFSAGAPSMSLDAVRLDMQYIPAPGAFALVAAAGIVARRRRRD
jgi:hypothetical protein